MKPKISLFLFIAFVVSFFTACKKDHHEAEDAKVKLHIHTMVGNKVANYTDTYADASGRSFRLSDLRYYLSNFVLITDNGKEVSIPDAFVLVRPDQTDYALGVVPTGHYSGLRFDVGLDSTINHSDPTIYPADHPLAPQTPSMHWSWSTGYIFFKLDGKVDTTLAANGSPKAPLVFHIGLDKLKRTVAITLHTDVKGDQENSLNVVFDLLRAFNGIDLRTENKTQSMDNLTLATKFAGNLPGAFIAE